MFENLRGLLFGAEFESEYKSYDYYQSNQQYSYNEQIQYSPNIEYNPQVIINSPEATLSTKKAMRMGSTSALYTPQTSEQFQTPKYKDVKSTSSSGMMDLLLIGIGTAMIGTILLNKDKGGKKK